MPNTIQFQTWFSKRMQIAYYKNPIFRAITSSEDRATLFDGQAVTRPYRSTLYAQTYTRGSDMTFQTLTDTAETLTVNTSIVSPFPFDSLDKIQQKQSFGEYEKYPDDAMRVINAWMDADVLSEYDTAANVIDAASVGGTAGQPINLDASNVMQVLSRARRKLAERNLNPAELLPTANEVAPGKLQGFSALAPNFTETLALYGGTRETVGGDEMFRNGYRGPAMGFDVYETNNLTWTGVLGLATQPTDGDTVVIAGVTFTFKTVLGSTAGNVLIGVSAATAAANLTAAINGASGSGSTYVALSAANRTTISTTNRITATVVSTTVVLEAVGASFVVVSETLTDAADVWSKLVQHNLIGIKGATDLVVQAEPEVQIDPIPAQLGVYIKPYTLYGWKTFREGTFKLVDVQINSASL